MTDYFICDFLNSNSNFKQLRHFLQEVFYLTTHFLKINGEVLIVPNNEDSTTLNLSMNQKNRISLKIKNTSHISADVLEEIIETKKPKFYFSEEENYRIIVPIIVREKLYGFIHIREHSISHLNESQLQSIMAYVKRIIDNIIKKDLSHLANYRAEDSTHQQKLIKRVIGYIQENYYEPNLSLNEISKRNNISYYYLSRLFKREKKMSFSSFLTQIRVDMAAKMLKDKSLSISEISRFCGFDDPSYFCKVFKKIRGTAPENYRKNNCVTTV